MPVTGDVRHWSYCMKLYCKCDNCGHQKPIDEKTCQHCVPKIELDERIYLAKMDNSTAKWNGLFFSIPAALVIIFAGSVSGAANSAFLVIAAIIFIVAFPWSVISAVLILVAVPMNTGLHPGVEGYSWRVILEYSAPLITILGAHYNGYKVCSKILQRKRRKAYAENNYK